jgi:hypothetical protein
VTTDTNSEGLSKNNSLGARRRGRPIGSGSKQKVLIAQAAVNDLKSKLAPYLPTEDLDYLTGVLDGQESRTLGKDLDIFLALQLKALLPHLADEIKGGELSREATQRSATVKELLALRFQMEKHNTGDERNDHITFIQNVFDSRGLDAGRMARLLGIDGARSASPSPRLVSGRVLGDADGDAGSADLVGAVPDQLPERSVEVQTGSEE